MRKALVYSLAVAMLLVSLTACHKSQADQPDNSQPEPATTSSQADVSTPEPPAEPEPEPPETPAPEQLSDTTSAASVETEDPQDQAEPAAQQEPAEPEPEPAPEPKTTPEPVKTEATKPVAPKQTETPAVVPVAAEPTEPEPQQNTGGLVDTSAAQGKLISEDGYGVKVYDMGETIEGGQVRHIDFSGADIGAIRAEMDELYEGFTGEIQAGGN